MKVDAVVVGAGPNGLAAAVTLARAGLGVRVIEGAPTIGGGCRSASLTLPGHVHDVCAAAHPMGVSSPCFRDLDLAGHGLAWIQPPLPLAHPLGGDDAVFLARDAEETAAGLGPDAAAYRRLVAPLVVRWDEIVEDLLAPPGLPRHPVAFGRFAALAWRSARSVGEARFRTAGARALLAGLAAHGARPVERGLTAGFALALAAGAHAAGWPLARGGSQAIADALAGVLGDLGGTVETGRWVRSAGDLPPARLVLWDVAPRNLVRIAGDRLPPAYRRRLLRFRHGPGVLKLDWALTEPIPWRAEACRRAGTVHLGATLAEIAAAERAVAQGRCPERPYAIVVQPSRFDPTRAPAGRHTAWAYCHTPPNPPPDLVERVERQIERYAPGFAQCVAARSVLDPAAMETHNPNYVGGDIGGGVQDLTQTLVRPASPVHPYRVPGPSWYLCSSSTPPGGGVHGMCGYHAARAALRDLGLKSPEAASGGLRRGGSG